jgi:hypothetical protein
MAEFNIVDYVTYRLAPSIDLGIQHLEPIRCPLKFKEPGSVDFGTASITIQQGIELRDALDVTISEYRDAKTS